MDFKPADWYRNRYLAKTHSLLFNSLYMQEETCWTAMLIPNINNNWPLKFQWQRCRVGKREKIPNVSRRGFPGTTKTRRCCCPSLSLQSQHRWGEHLGINQATQSKTGLKGNSAWCSRNSTNALGRESCWRTVVEGALSGDKKCWAVSLDLQHGWLSVPSPRALARQSCCMTF